MTTTYEKALRGSTLLKDADFSDEPLESSRGSRFLAICDQAGVGPDTDMAEFNRRFHRFPLDKGWIWAPAGPGASYLGGARLLDGSVDVGECALPVGLEAAVGIEAQRDAIEKDVAWG